MYTREGTRREVSTREGTRRVGSWRIRGKKLTAGWRRGFVFFEDLGRGTRTVGTEGGAGDLGELLARLHVLDHRLIEPGHVLVPVLSGWKGNGGRGQRLVLGGWMPQKVPVQIWADARRAGARSRATTAPDADTAVDNRRDDCIDRARQLVERGDGPMGPGNPLGGRRRRVKGSRPPPRFRAEEGIGGTGPRSARGAAP